MFSRWSPIYEEEVTENFYSAADETAKVAIRYLSGEPLLRPSIADIGIGTGLLSQQIYDAMPCSITGLDFTDDMLAICAARNITELLIKCDVGKDSWPLENQSTDTVLSSGLFEYLTEDMAQHFFKEAARITKQNSLLIFTYIPAAGAKTASIYGMAIPAAI